jgi:hypothetical protein
MTSLTIRNNTVVDEAEYGAAAVDSREGYFPALSGPCESIFNLYRPSRAVM